jgi:5-(aminomethyl)-3-furanmethanol phosphate kinase
VARGSDMSSPIVIKVGGSLFDLPDLAGRLAEFLNALDGRRWLLVPGGGAPVDAIRKLDATHVLGEEPAHWLALRTLSVNAFLLSQLLAGGRGIVSAAMDEWPALWRNGDVPILDAYAFALADEARRDHLPHSWDVTSDSLAARVALLLGARRLILLKSVPPPEGADRLTSGPQGIVDPFFKHALKPEWASHSCQIEIVNLREWKPR